MQNLKTSLAALGVLAAASFAHATEIEAVPPEATFASSGGYWEEAAADAAENAAPRKGYYKLVSLRQPDRTARVYLQQIAVTDDGLEAIATTELEAFSQQTAYVTDIRPENSNGVSREPGLFATVFVKTDPAMQEPESWTVIVDDVGDIKVERASN